MTTLASGTATIDRSVLGVDEDRRPDEAERPYWTDLPMDGEPVHVSHATALVRSAAQAHDATVTVELGQSPSHSDEGCVLLGEWAYQSGSGEAGIYTLDDKELDFTLPSDSQFTLRIWRQGGEIAGKRFRQLMGVEYPITGLEDYRFLFTPSN
ncbi:hypothetical protein AB0Q95_44700 [Streptomyces sp. NPDC059900]|uniref:hypothetical protein n=1 Tax=Streptomyces sp. NPDC059900 TaxID=3155816 RepID=UPI0034453D40